MSRLKPESAPNSGLQLLNDTDNGFRIVAGRAITQRINLEVVYEDIGRAQFSHLNPAISDRLNIDYAALGINAVYWLNERDSKWRYLVNAGLSYLKTDTNATVVKDNQLHRILGAGIQRRLTSNLAIRLDFNSYSKDATVIGLSLVNYFKIR